MKLKKGSSDYNEAFEPPLGGRGWTVKEFEAKGSDASWSV